MAMEYEIRSARNRDLPLLEGRCNSPGRTRSESPPSRHRRTSEHYTSKVTMPFKKFQTLSGTRSLFKVPEGRKISPREFRKIQIAIHRRIYIAGGAAADELKRDVPDVEDVVLKRRVGEGSKPIFDREEIKRAVAETDVDEHPTVVTSRHPRERSYRERSRYHYRDWRKTGRSREGDRPREQRVPQEEFPNELLPVPIYYGYFQPGPLMVGPWVPIRGPLGGIIHPPMMRQYRPLMYGFRPPLNPRFPQRFYRNDP